MCADPWARADFFDSGFPSGVGIFVVFFRFPVVTGLTGVLCTSDCADDCFSLEGALSEFRNVAIEH